MATKTNKKKTRVPSQKEQNNNLMKKKALPKPGPIVLKHIDGHDLNNVEMSDAQKFAVDLFGSDLVEFSED